MQVRFLSVFMIAAICSLTANIEAQSVRSRPKKSTQTMATPSVSNHPGRVVDRSRPAANMSFTGQSEVIMRDRAGRHPSYRPRPTTRPHVNVNQQNNTQVNVINQSGVGNTVNNVNVQNVQNIVNNVTNVTNINNQQINNTVVNNFRGPGYGGPVYGGPNPWNSGYGYVHTHWQGTNSRWNFRYRPSIWMNQSTTMSYGIGPVVQYNFVNPYTLPAPISYFYGYDYSRPIRPTLVEPSGRVTEEAIRRLDAARDAFRQRDYRRCLDLLEGAIRLLPDDPALHEFRALALFAIGEFDAAATVIYSVLGANPGSDWNTVSRLYDSQEIYLSQLRELTRYVASVPDRPGPRFLLAYHLLVVGYPEAAYDQLVTVQRLRPDDRVTAEILRALRQTQQ